MPRLFTAASDEVITVDDGAFGSFSSGASGFSIAVLVLRGTRTNTADNECLVTANGGAKLGFGFQSSLDLDRMFLRNGTNNQERNSGALTLTSSDGWAIVGVHTISTTEPRFHRYVFSTGAWTHTLGNDWLSAVFPGTLTDFSIGNGADTATNTGPFNGDIGAVAMWNGKSLTDAEFERLSGGLNAWINLAPTALWVLDQDSTSQTVLDWMGTKADQTAITGTAVSTSSAPLNYGHRVLVPGVSSTPATVTGTVAVTLAATTSVASGSSVTGTVAKTLADATIVAAGASGASGDLAETLEDTTSTTVAGVGASGAAAATLDDATVAADGTHSIAGTVAVTLDDATVAADGTHSVAGTVAVTLDDATVAADGTADSPEATNGTVDSLLADINSAASGDVGASGDTAATLEDITCDAAGAYTADFTGSLAATLAAVTATASGTSGITAAADTHPALVTIRHQQFTRKLRYHRTAERPALSIWVHDARDELIDFSDPSYTFVFRVGRPGYNALLDKSTNISGAAGSGVEGDGTPNVTVLWEPGELDIAPGVYACELVATTTSLDLVFHGTFEIINTIL